MLEGRTYHPFLQGILNSYSQVFFSSNPVFAWIIVAVTFFDPYSGLSGLLSVLAANAVAWYAGFNKEKISRGYYGFNSLLVGLGLGIQFYFNNEFLLVLVFGSLLTLFLTLTLEGVIGKYHLPYLSVPFIFSIWLILLATREFQYLQVNERWVYSLNDMYSLGGMPMVRIYEWFNSLNWPKPVVIYFRSLGAIFFQYHLFPGLIIMAGLLIYSRIAFLFSIIGFFSAYLFYQFVGIDLSVLSYTNIGFNYILTAIAVGSFFIIPSWYSIIWAILLTPLIAIILTASAKLFSLFQLSIYALPFNAVALVFLYVLKFRERHFSKPELVYFQQFSPERNLYDQRNNQKRFSSHFQVRAVLPFWGEWKVTQGHEGKQTHKSRWRHAWDFELFDPAGRSYQSEGSNIKDYYCFDKPVLAAADGWVIETENAVEDNDINQVNLEENWGNTVVIKHTEHVYSSVNHLRKGSVKVSRGDFVKRGDIIAHCGNSGRSPVPHLHFQFQATPQIGSMTLDHPISHYMLKDENAYRFESFERPSEGEVVSNIEPNHALKKAFVLTPGQEVSLAAKREGSAESEALTWDVMADVYNNTYLQCRKTKARAYFRAEEDMFYFTHYDGTRKAELYQFYLGCYKVVFGQHPSLEISDTYPAYALTGGLLLVLQDLFAPFCLFIRSRFRLSYRQQGQGLMDHELTLVSCSSFSLGRKHIRETTFEVRIVNEVIHSVDVIVKGKNKLHLRWEGVS